MLYGHRPEQHAFIIESLRRRGRGGGSETLMHLDMYVDVSHLAAKKETEYSWERLSRRAAKQDTETQVSVNGTKKARSTTECRSTCLFRDGGIGKESRILRFQLVRKSHIGRHCRGRFALEKMRGSVSQKSVRPLNRMWPVITIRRNELHWSISRRPGISAPPQYLPSPPAAAHQTRIPRYIPPDLHLARIAEPM